MRSFNCGMTLPLRLYVDGLAENRISTSMSNFTGKPRICTSRSSRMLNRPTCTNSSSSGNSFMAKMPRCMRGISPKCNASSADMLVPPASLAGSISPMMSANWCPGQVVRHSARPAATSRSARGFPAYAARKRLHTPLIGWYGSSCSGASGMSMYGISSSRKRTSDRISRLLACPFSPRNSMSCCAIRARVDLGDDRVLVADDARETALRLRPAEP